MRSRTSGSPLRHHLDRVLHPVRQKGPASTAWHPACTPTRSWTASCTARSGSRPAAPTCATHRGQRGGTHAGERDPTAGAHRQYPVVPNRNSQSRSTAITGGAQGFKYSDRPCTTGSGFDEGLNSATSSDVRVWPISSGRRGHSRAGWRRNSKNLVSGKFLTMPPQALRLGFRRTIR
jgi:hypothetical protein